MSSKHENCSHSNMYSAKITYTYSQFLFDAITSVDTELSDKSKYGKKAIIMQRKKQLIMLIILYVYLFQVKITHVRDIEMQ